MSYNITRFRVKSLDLSFPLSFDFQEWIESQPNSTGKRWCIEDENTILTNLAASTWKLKLGSQELSGTIKGDRYVVDEIDWRSDGSGTLYEDILLPLFREFQGSLEALVVWEGGDTVKQVNIQKGEISEVEL
jgi:hypothetical protein